VASTRGHSATSSDITGMEEQMIPPPDYRAVGYYHLGTSSERRLPIARTVRAFFALDGTASRSAQFCRI